MKRISILFALLAVSCATKETSEPVVPDTAIIIFEDAPAQSTTSRFGGGISSWPESTLEYVDSTARRIYYIPRNIGRDTLSIPVRHGYAEVIHWNQAIEYIPYLLMAGDTVLFTYGENLRPQITSLTSGRNTRLYNLPFEDARAVQPIGYATKTVLNDPHYKMAKEQGYIDLDSLRSIDEAFSKDFAARLDSLERTGEIPAVYADFYRRKMRTPERIEELRPLLNDSMMHYMSGHLAAHRYAFASKASDAAERFDRIAADTTLPPLARRAMLHEIMTHIESGEMGFHPYSAQEIEHYRERYREITGDSTFVVRQISKANRVDDGGYATDLVLQGLDGKQYDFGAVLEEHRGKVVYVDMWASWCAPCLAGMPDAKKLREAYRSRDVVFIYLAINDTEAAWRGAVKSSETDYLGLNYRILNAEESLFLRQIKHNYIPHFLIYDRTGALVDMNAPRPGEEKLKRKIDELLQKTSLARTE